MRIFREQIGHTFLEPSNLAELTKFRLVFVEELEDWLGFRNRLRALSKIVHGFLENYTSVLEELDTSVCGDCVVLTRSIVNCDQVFEILYSKMFIVLEEF